MYGVCFFFGFVLMYKKINRGPPSLLRECDDKEMMMYRFIFHLTSILSVII